MNPLEFQIAPPFDNPLTRAATGPWYHDNLVASDRDWHFFNQHLIEARPVLSIANEFGVKPSRIERLLGKVNQQFAHYLQTDRSTIDEIHSVDPEWLPWCEMVDVYSRSVAWAGDMFPPPPVRPSRIPEDRWKVLVSWYNNINAKSSSGLSRYVWERKLLLAARPLAGLNTVDPKLRKEPGLNVWRRAVISRDNYRCASCGSRELLEAHHIASYAENKEKRTDVANGITLCRPCHKAFHR
jgi:hypothetical protein